MPKPDSPGFDRAVVVGIPERSVESGSPSGRAADFVVVSHRSLFEEAGRSSSCCDACGASVAEGEGESEHDGYCVRGEGVYQWVRGDERRLEKAPLCSSCAAAIGMTALARWEIEEEEG
jgi:hypothetical protein